MCGIKGEKENENKKGVTNLTTSVWQNGKLNGQDPGSKFERKQNRMGMDLGS